MCLKKWVATASVDFYECSTQALVDCWQKWCFVAGKTYYSMTITYCIFCSFHENKKGITFGASLIGVLKISAQSTSKNPWPNWEASACTGFILIKILNFK